ncbi:hypothetical protein JOD54_003371 [Actinokineospora baliensis]|uniref:hypothetical protein n=1 Tax=Actinokineospora baliensis TaxID=547056 RepID=UPI001EF7D3D7|nr:hypothetical protein [Actinokineospora baliensis]MBM7773167.1 hypothetical protein [Actinokineospora baliensis]
MSERLGHKETAVMLVLMALAREVSNPELKDLVGYPLDGKERRRLNELRLVESRLAPKRFFVHELTDSGWKWCADEFAAGSPPPPVARSTFVPAFYLLLAALDRYLRRENVSLAEVFTSDVELTPGQIEERVRAGYSKLARSVGDWVSLVDLRAALGGANRAEVDAVLKEMSRTGRANLVPESNRKALTDRHHAAAIRVGGEDNHLISIEAS